MFLIEERLFLFLKRIRSNSTNERKHKKNEEHVRRVCCKTKATHFFFDNSKDMHKVSDLHLPYLDRGQTKFYVTCSNIKHLTEQLFNCFQELLTFLVYFIDLKPSIDLLQ